MGHVKVVLILTISLLIFISCSGLVYGADQADAINTIAEAEERMVDCYDAIVAADEAGANASVLVATLNEAGELLSTAELSYEMGDYDSAVLLASQSRGMLDGFVIEAEALTEIATAQHYWSLIVVVVVSVGGTITAICGSFIVWRFLKKSYGEGAKK